MNQFNLKSTLYIFLMENLTRKIAKDEKKKKKNIEKTKRILDIDLDEER